MQFRKSRDADTFDNGLPSLAEVARAEKIGAHVVEAVTIDRGIGFARNKCETSI